MGLKTVGKIPRGGGQLVCKTRKAVTGRGPGCFVAGTPVIIAPTGAESRWLVTGVGVLSVGVVAYGYTRSSQKKKRGELDRDDVFGGDELDTLYDPLDNDWDDNHVGLDFVELEQQPLDRLCDQLFNGDESDWSIESTVARIDESPRSSALALRDVPSFSPQEKTAVRTPSPTLDESSQTQVCNLPVSQNNSTSDGVSANLRGGYVKLRASDAVRGWLGFFTLLACLLFASFCFFKASSERLSPPTCPIEEIHPGNKVIVDAPKEALATDFARLAGRKIRWDAGDGSLDVKDVADPLRELGNASPAAIKRADYRLLILQAKEAWEDGTYNEINVETLQPWQWIQEHEVHVGGMAPLPLDTREMGIPEGMAGKVIDILPCPQIETGRGRVVLTTVNRLARGVIELTLRDASGREETLRPTDNHLFYSISQGEWLPAEQLHAGEHLNGIDGNVTITSITQIPGTHRVYNFSVQGEHLYRVGGSGVLERVSKLVLGGSKAF